MRAREGDFLQTSNGLLFDVKGLLHPPDRIVAYLRYYPDRRGSRWRDGVRYVKVYDLTKRRLMLEKKWPLYLYYDEMQGRELQGVPKSHVLTLYTPQQRLAALLSSTRKDTLEASATRLVKTLVQETELTSERFGVSGSLLVGLHQEDSDLDIIVYGRSAAERVQRALCIFLDDDRVFHRYRTSDLRRLFKKRNSGQAFTFRDFELQERRKTFQGRYMRHEYFIRCVKNWGEIQEQYGDVRFSSVGECMISGQVTDDKESLQTPSRYSLEQVKVLAGNSSRSPCEVVSFRGRFAEQVLRGERILARGRLEAVQSEESEYFRLVVGEGPKDVLRTIW